MARVKNYIVLILLILAAYLVIISPQQKFYNAHHVNISGTYLIKPLEINDFALIDTRGEIFDKNRLKKQWTFIYFGFTHCEMVCPVTLTVLDKTYHLLKQQLPFKNLPQVVFVSIDAKEDNINQLKNYIKNINPYFIGAITNAQQLISLQKIFHIVVKPVTIQGKQTFDHTPDILLINPQAKIQAYFSYPQQESRLAKDYFTIVNKER